MIKEEKYLSLKDKALLKAVECFEFEEISNLVKAGANPNLAESEGNTLLHVACDFQNLDTVMELLESGANPNLCNARGNTPLHVALDRHSEAVARALIDSGKVDIAHVDRLGNNYVHWAAIQNKPEALKALLSQGVPVDVCPSHGMTALLFAVERSYEKCADILLAHGANIEAADSNGRRSLLLAVMHRMASLTETLIKRGADVSAGDLKGVTALHRATENKLERISLMLLEAGANPNAMGARFDNHGVKPTNCMQWLIDSCKDTFESDDAKRDKTRGSLILVAYGASISNDTELMNGFGEISQAQAAAMTGLTERTLHLVGQDYIDFSSKKITSLSKIAREGGHGETAAVLESVAARRSIDEMLSNGGDAQPQLPKIQ